MRGRETYDNYLDIPVSPEVREFLEENARELKRQRDHAYDKARYYSESVHVNGADYVMCSQWVERQDNNDRPYLMRWIREHQ